jgi:hypothetical protein
MLRFVSHTPKPSALNAALLQGLILRASPSWWSVRPADVLSITASGIYVNTARDNLSPQMVICMFLYEFIFCRGIVW